MHNNNNIEQQRKVTLDGMMMVAINMIIKQKVQQ